MLLKLHIVIKWYLLKVKPDINYKIMKVKKISNLFLRMISQSFFGAKC